jgi:hypothetical protein
MDNPNLSQKVFSSLSHNFISIYFNNCWYFRNPFNVVQSKSLTYFNKTPFIPSHFNTSHLFSRNLIPCTLTLVAQNSATLLLLSTSILKKAGVGGCPVAKPLTCKFEAKTAHAPDCADGTGAAEEGQHEEQAPPPPSAAEAAAAARESPAPPTPPKAKGAKDRRAEGPAGPSVD